MPSKSLFSLALLITFGLALETQKAMAAAEPHRASQKNPAEPRISTSESESAKQSESNSSDSENDRIRESLRHNRSLQQIQIMRQEPYSCYSCWCTLNSESESIRISHCMHDDMIHTVRYCQHCFENRMKIGQARICPICFVLLTNEWRTDEARYPRLPSK